MWFQVDETIQKIKAYRDILQYMVVSYRNIVSKTSIPHDMAGDFLRSHGIDLDAEMARIQQNIPGLGSGHAPHTSTAQTSKFFRNVSLPNTPSGSLWNVTVTNGLISDITSSNSQTSILPSINAIDGKGALLAPSLCHPHVHIDKAYLLSHPKYSHLQIERGDFAEAMELTGKAKAKFEGWDLLERGQRVIDESVAAGVTHMRAFVEVDAGVGTQCLNAGSTLKQRAEDGGKCMVQLCAFAQLPLFSSSPNDEDGAVVRKLMQEAAGAGYVDVVGSTPYVESDRERMERNVEWMVGLSIEHDVHLDFHLDYNLDPQTEPLVWHVIQTLKEKEWKERTTCSTVVLGHCTRLTLFKDDQWQRLRDEIGELPVSFVGLPTSDLFMMRTTSRVRGTLDVLTLIKDYGLNACIGINNIGNAFTPHGSCDPLTLACNGIGIYQAGTVKDAELLYECVSTRAMKAIGFRLTSGEPDASCDKTPTLQLRRRKDGSLLLFGSEEPSWRTRRSIAEVVYLYDHARDRRAYLGATPS